MPLPGPEDQIDPREWVMPPVGASEAPEPAGEPEQPPSASPRFASYDPAQLRPQNTTVPTQVLYDSAGEILPEFDERYRDDFVGLLYLGALSSTFHWMGHEFVIRSLSVDETLAIGQLLQPFEGSLARPRAYSAAVAALCVSTVDGQGLPVPFEESIDLYAWAQQRFDYVKARWFAPTIDKVYNEYLVLESRVEEVVAAMEKAYDPAGLTAGSPTRSAKPNVEAR